MEDGRDLNIFSDTKKLKSEEMMITKSSEKAGLVEI